MLRKFFRNLTQSDEDRYLESYEAFAKSLETASPQLAEITRDVAQLKGQIDQCVDGSKPAPFEVADLGDKAKAICDGIQSQLRELQKLDQNLPKVLASGSGEQLTSHVKRWENGNQILMRATAALRYIATGTSSNGMTDFPSGGGAMKAAIEDLELQIRTAERIKNELGG